MADTKISSNKVVAYIGMSDWRLIREEDWDAVDVKGSEVMWSSKNGWQIPVDKFTDDQLTYLASDPDFVIKDAIIPDLT